MRRVLRSFLCVTCVCAIAFAVASGPQAKAPVTKGETDPVLVDLTPYLLKKLAGGANARGGEFGPDASLADVADDPEFRRLVKKHDLRLFGGPMLGCVTDRSARVWVRTPGAARVQAVVGAGPAESMKSKVASTSKVGDFTAVLEVDGLEPFTTYGYDVLVDGRSVFEGKHPAFRTSPAKGQKARFSVAFGGGARYVPKHEPIWATIAARRPHAFLFLGDNIYTDIPQRRDVQRVYYYRRQLRSEFRLMCASSAVQAIWDDHDFGKNDCAGGLETFNPEWKLPVWKVFRENWNNPYYGGGEKQPGCWFDFSIGDIDFFMTDGRYYRDFKRGTMLGPVQKRWLLKKLAASKATFKVIASGTLWTERADKGGKDSWQGVREERDEIFSLIDRERIGGVVLISADRHRSEIWEIKRANGYTLYEFESSKLTNMHTHKTRKEAAWSYNKGNFFGMLTFDLTKR
ncbi:MAG: alkaline phosphatase D family protein, partial [Planctomycetota bacterium]